MDNISVFLRYSRKSIKVLKAVGLNRPADILQSVNVCLENPMSNIASKLNRNTLWGQSLHSRIQNIIFESGPKVSKNCARKATKDIFLNVFHGE